MRTLLALAFAAIAAAQSLEWPGLPMDAAATTSTRIVRITIQKNPPRYIMEEIPAPSVPAPTSFAMLETTKATETDWCVDPNSARLVASITAVYREQTGLTRYVGYPLGSGIVVAAWSGCATGIRFSNPPGTQYGTLQRVSAFASNTLPTTLAAVSPLGLHVAEVPTRVALANLLGMPEAMRGR